MSHDKSSPLGLVNRRRRPQRGGVQPVRVRLGDNAHGRLGSNSNTDASTAVTATWGGLGRGWTGVPGGEGHFGWNRSSVQQWTV